MLSSLLVALTMLVGVPATAQAPVPTIERVADIQVHGNTLTSEARILELSGIQTGSPVTHSTVDEVAARLRNAQLFQRVEVLKRYASIADASQIAIVIVVDEGPVRVVVGDGDAPATVERRRGPQWMFLPILTFEDGYGLSYGVQSTIPEPFGKGSRVSFPVTWGGEKRAAMELEAPLGAGPVTRIRAGVGLSRRENPYFDEPDDRGRVWGRVERDIRGSLRLGATGAFERVAFLGEHETFLQTGVDAVIDTRLDPFLPRHAVYARAAWDALRFDRAPDANRLTLDASGYLGFVGQSIVVLRGQRVDASRPLPLALRPLLGGGAVLRGFDAGSAIGDTLVTASGELRVPLTSPLSIGKVGVSALLDVGSVYDEGGHVSAQRFERGVGVGVWLSATFVRASVHITHGLGGSTRALCGLTASF